VNGIRLFQESSANMLALPSGSSLPGGRYAAQSPQAVAEQMGVPQSRIMTQLFSRNTMEDALEAERLIPRHNECRIGVVTCALHMRRAKWAFEKKFPDDTIVPVPVGHRYMKPSLRSHTLVPSAEALHNSTRALHEWIGLLWYALRYAQVDAE